MECYPECYGIQRGNFVHFVRADGLANESGQSMFARDRLTRVQAASGSIDTKLVELV